MKELSSCARSHANGLPYDAYEGAGRKVPRADSSRTYLLGRDCGQAPSAKVGAIATSEQGGAPNTSIFQSSSGALPASQYVGVVVADLALSYGDLYGLSYGDLWKQSTEAGFPDPAGCFSLEKSPRVEMGPCTEPARSTSRAQLPPRPATSPSLVARWASESISSALWSRSLPPSVFEPLEI